MSYKNNVLLFSLISMVILLSACQANYIRDTQGGNVAPSSSVKVTGVTTP